MIYYFIVESLMLGHVFGDVDCCLGAPLSFSLFLFPHRPSVSLSPIFYFLSLQSAKATRTLFSSLLFLCCAVFLFRERKCGSFEDTVTVSFLRGNFWIDFYTFVWMFSTLWWVDFGIFNLRLLGFFPLFPVRFSLCFEWFCFKYRFTVAFASDLS